MAMASRVAPSFQRPGTRRRSSHSARTTTPAIVATRTRGDWITRAGFPRAGWLDGGPPVRLTTDARLGRLPHLRQRDGVKGILLEPARPLLVPGRQ